MKNLKLLVPLDSSKNSKRTVKTLLEMKSKIQCPLTLLHVFDPERISYKGETVVDFALYRKRAKEAAEKFLEEKKALFTSEGMQVEQTILKTGPPRRIICELADSGDFDLLIIGRHAEGELRNLLFGQVSNYVIHNVKCPVLVI